MIWNNLLRLFRNLQEILQICITFYSQEILRIFKWAKNFHSIDRINDKESSLIAWELIQAHESDESKQSVSFDQISEFASRARFKSISSISQSILLLVSLLQWHFFVNAIIYLLTSLYSSVNQTTMFTCS